MLKAFKFHKFKQVSKGSTLAAITHKSKLAEYIY